MPVESDASAAGDGEGTSRGAGPRLMLTGIVKTYAGAVAVDGVSLDIAGGSFVALVGASGSGKSTLLRMVNRLVDPDCGQIEIDGVDLSAAAPALLRRRIGTVFQAAGLFDHLSVAENIALPLALGRADWFRGARRAARNGERRVTELLDLVDLPQTLASRAPATLSGGQAQRVGLARALATAPRLMLMDEPFGALDPVTRDQLGRRVRALHDRLRLTTILVTHDMAEALLLADRVLVMASGRIVADATPHALLAGVAGAEADALVAVPREQSRRLAAMTTAARP